jgi:phosphoribosyl-AMP cyclohydrolase / phosphoribosyl-ATP pyrophosphohydrolase
VIDAGSANLDFAKMGGLIPAIVQDASDKSVLMVGFMNEAAWQKTVDSGRVTFFRRTTGKLWTKGETSGHYLEVRRVWTDCDADSLLIEAIPHGPTCHTGSQSCFFEEISVAKKVAR